MACAEATVSPSGCQSTRKVVALYGTMHAGGVAVPVNALLKAPQVAHILRDSDATVLVTTAARVGDSPARCPTSPACA